MRYLVGSVVYFRPEGVVQVKVPSGCCSTFHFGCCLTRWSCRHLEPYDWLISNILANWPTDYSPIRLLNGKYSNIVMIVVSEVDAEGWATAGERGFSLIART
jgi:hypothetical protein